MSNIEFEADMQNNPRYRSAIPGQQAGNQNTGMTRWLVSHGIANSDNVAKYILLAFVAINFAATAFILYFFVL